MVNKVKKAASDRRYYEANREKEIARVAQWARDHPDRRAAIAKRYYESHKEERLAHNRAYRQQYRDDALTAYGGKCACCGETTPEFLGIDHISNDGSAQRQETSTIGGYSTPTFG